MLDILVFSPHPDDAELGCGGAIIKATLNHLRVNIVDLTAGELGTHVSKEIRLKEAEKAQKILGVDIRENLGLPDGTLGLIEKADYIFLIAEKIREYKPKIVLAPYWEDRHPDHIMTSNLITKACHYAKLKKVTLKHPEHQIEQIIYYEINNQFANPSFIMDISDVFDRKKEAIMAYDSQFKEFTREFLPFPVKERCQHYGSIINADFGEAFLLKNKLKLLNWSIFF